MILEHKKESIEEDIRLPRKLGTDFENKDRPKTFDDFIGQERVIEQLKETIHASNKLGITLDHMLFTGPPGLGKTTLAKIVANYKGTKIIEAVGEMLKQPNDLINLFDRLAPGNILFIDEIHGMDKGVELLLHSPMEDFKIGDDLVNPFTLIGATTEKGLLSDSFLNRFGLEFRLKFYNKGDIAKIVKKVAPRLNVQLSDDGAKDIANCSRQTPRTAIRILKRARDKAVVESDIEIFDSSTGPVCVNGIHVKKTMKTLGIDIYGYDDLDRDYLILLADSFPIPIGLDTIASSLSEKPITILNLEHYFLHQGLVIRTKSGRILSPKAIRWTHLGLTDIIKNNHGGIIPESKFAPRKKVVESDVINLKEGKNIEKLPFDLKSR